MFARGLVSRARFGLAVFLILPAAVPDALGQDSPRGVIRQDRVIAGSSKDSLEVRHLVLRGTNEEIGRALAEFAKERYQAKAEPSRDRLRTGAQRRYIEKNFPILHERMRGVAAAFEQRLEDDTYNHSGLDFSELRAGCSVFYLPPKCTAQGTGSVSRDFNFTTSRNFAPLT